MIDKYLFGIDPLSEKSPPKRISLSGFLANIPIAWKMGLIALVLSLGILGIAGSAYLSVQTLRYHLSNIYDFMLIPIVAINGADTALADTQYDLQQLRAPEITATERAQAFKSIDANETLTAQVIARYDNEWVTTVSPDFTEQLRLAGQLGLQEQEVATLKLLHIAFDQYKVERGKYLASVRAGKPDIALANTTVQKLATARVQLQYLIKINNKFAEISDRQAQAAYQQGLISGGLVLAIALSLGLLMSYLIVVSITSRLADLTRSTAAMQAGDLYQTVALSGQDEITLLGETFNSMGFQLKTLFNTMEQRVEERTQELKQAYDDVQAGHEKLLQSERMASLGRLASGVAHEINTPLAASRAALMEIRTLANEYHNSLNDPQVTPDDYREIEQELTQSLDLADHALERIAGFVSGIKAQTRDLTRREHLQFNAIPIIRESLLLVSHALHAGNCTVTFEPQMETAELYGVPGQLAQVVTNLVTNAIDASAEKGGGPIAILLTQSPDQIDLAVSDQGSGIPLEIQAKIFDLLFTTKPFGQGTGLGLNITRDIMTEVFGGSIELTSRVGEGTTFTLHFPRSKGDENGA